MMLHQMFVVYLPSVLMEDCISDVIYWFRLHGGVGLLYCLNLGRRRNMDPIKSKVDSGFSQTSRMEVFSKNRQQHKAVIYFC